MDKNTSLAKKLVREKIWRLLEERGLALPPRPLYGRIPNFVGAEKAASLLRETKEWRTAKIVKVNPDSPQKWVRLFALKEGKILIFASPRLQRGFIILDPRRIPGYDIDYASTIKGAFKYGRPIDLVELKELEIDLMVTGSVAVDKRGHRVGKGEGYAELEYGILREVGSLSASTPVATTVHDLQIVEDVPRDPYDIVVDIVATPRRLIRISSSENLKPRGIYWELLPCEKLRKIPILLNLASLKEIDPWKLCSRGRRVPTSS
ncbi:MAG: 5-formyltetrahydrofolate cyclo-ligase [Pyrodictiaceae archaeon]